MIADTNKENRPEQENKGSGPVPRNASQDRSPSVLCLLDFVLGNMTIHYSRTRVLHPRQGLEDVMEVVREENLLSQNIKLVYCLVGRADVLLAPAAFARLFDKLLLALARINPRIMCVIGGIVACPGDSNEIRNNVVEINQSLARLAERDHHWLFFNPNICLSFGGEPQRKFFDGKAQLVRSGCRAVAQALVAASKSARMLQNFGVLPPIGSA